MTPRKLAILRKQRWNEALREGRIVRIADGMTLRSYPTVADAQAAVVKYRNLGESAEIVACIQSIADGEGHHD